MRRIFVSAVCVGLMVIGGCGQPAKKEQIALDKVPENVMQIAKKRFPGVNFTRAFIEKNGDYELRGTDLKGKTYEVDISPDGSKVTLD